MESIIDVQLVKEQLRLLGHDVADGVILDFIKDLSANRASGGTAAANNSRAALERPANSDAAVRDTRAPSMPINSQVNTLGSSKETGRQTASKQPSDHAAAWASNGETDAAPSKMQQAPDQQSPKRLPVSGPAGHEQDSPPAPSMLQRAALDQRCRNFLSRCSDKFAPQQHQEQQQQQEPLPQQPILLQVPHLQDKAAASAHSSSSQLSSAASSELNLDDAGIETDSSEGDMQSLGLQQSSSRRLLGQANLQQSPAAVADCTQRPQQQGLHAQLGAEIGMADNSSESDSEGSSVGLEAEGSKFLLHQAATMQRVRARLAAKMAGYTAAAANAAHTTSAITTSDAQKAVAGAGASAGAAVGSAAAVGAAASTGTASSSGTTSSSIDSAAAAQPAAADSNQLPRFGFRPSYKPVGIHMPPPPSAAAVEALAAARTLRQQAAAGGARGAPAAARNSSQKGVSVPPLKLDVHMQSLSSAVNRLHDQHQAVQQLPTSVGMGSSSGLHLVASPGKAACASVVAGARANGSIIGGETPPCLLAAGHKTRQSPRVDPLYLAPSSPRRSNPATPRSSPALSPVPLAPLSAAAVGMGLMRSPAGTAPAAAVGATRSASSNGSRQCLTFSAGSRTAAGRSSAQQQQQRDSAGSTRRVASAPPTPSAVAPIAAHRGMTPGAGSSSASASYSARRSSVSHESLYCQRLAYSSQRSTVAPGVRKTDRVARFQQMQQQWSRDRFLSSGGGGAAAKKTAGQQ